MDDLEIDKNQRDNMEKFILLMAKRLDGLNAKLIRVSIAHTDGTKLSFVIPSSCGGVMNHVARTGEEATMNHYHPKAWKELKRFFFEPGNSVLSIEAFSEARGAGVIMGLVSNGETFSAVKPMFENPDEVRKARIFPVDFFFERAA